MRTVWLGVAGGALAVVMLGAIVGCEGGGGGGSASVTGNVVSFETAWYRQPAVKASWLERVGQVLGDLVPSAQAATPSAMGGPGGITVTLTGPETRSAVTADDGTFQFLELEEGAYGVRFEFEGNEVRYRGRSGQEATITVGTNQTAQLIDIRISGGQVNIGNIRIMDQVREQDQVRDRDRDGG